MGRRRNDHFGSKSHTASCEPADPDAVRCVVFGRSRNMAHRDRLALVDKERVDKERLQFRNLLIIAGTQPLSAGSLAR